MARDLATEWRKVMYRGIDQSVTRRDKESDGGINLWTQKGLANRCFCISCHKPYGAVLKYTSTIIYLCDDCMFKYGGLPLPQVQPEELNEMVSDLDPAKIRLYL